jgi:hypothetical protein
VIVICLTRVRRGIGTAAKIFILLFLAGFGIPKVVDVVTRVVVPAGTRAADRLGIVIQKMLRIIGVGG